jgi:hypothetical protein
MVKQLPIAKKAGSTALPLIGIKLLHSAIWAVMAGSILFLPVTGILRRFDWAGAITGLVLVECAVLALNKGRCPLTDWAAPYTDNRDDNFDIYLPVWIARHNKAIFGTLFVLGEAVVIYRWVV